MTTHPQHRATLAAIRRTLAAHYACDEAALITPGVVITTATERAGRLDFPLPAKPLQLVTLGAGVVISSHPSRHRWLRANLAQYDRDTLFAAPTIAKLARYLARNQQVLVGPVLRYACAPDSFRAVAPPADTMISLVVGQAITALYRHHDFANALAYRESGPRPDVLATVALRGGVVIGIAGASADNDLLWQIGVDVVPQARGAGVGRALVSVLTAAVFDHGRIPYYSTTVANLPSRALAQRLGYWPAWTELYARDH